MAVDQPAGREIRPFDEAHQVFDGDVVHRLPVLEHVDQRVADFAEIMRRDVGGHADGNPRRAVDQQVGDVGRQDGWFLQRAVEIVGEIDGVHVDVDEQFLAHFGHAGFGVAHGCRAVAVYAAEVALTVDQRVAHREILRHAHQRLVDRRHRRAGDTCPALRRRYARISCKGVSERIPRSYIA